MKKYVAYCRVSTQRQEVSGLGLEGQRQTVKNFIGSNELLREFTEVESGKNDKRYELAKAIRLAKDNSATLIIAKLDRLSRNASFIMQLKDSRVDFQCCDIPDANTLTIGIFALIAQQERELISERTKRALQIKKSQGYVLGTPGNLTEKSRQTSKAVRRENAINDENNKKALALINSMRSNNLSYRKIAQELNANGFRTRRGNLFLPNSVRQLCKW